MINLRVKILEFNEDIHIYTDVSSVVINGDNVSIEYDEDQNATHHLSSIDEVTVTTNHQEES